MASPACSSNEVLSFFSKDLVAAALGFYRYLFPSNSLRHFFQEDQTYAASPSLFPWMSIFVLSLLIVIAMLLAVKHTSWNKAYKIGSARCCTATTVLATILCVGTAAYAVVVNDYFYESYIRGECSMLSATEDSLAGHKESGWNGLEGGIRELSEIVTFLDEHFDNSTQETWGHSDWMNGAIEDIRQEIDFYYERYSEMGVLSPNPRDDYFTKIKTYYTARLGPSTMKGTFTELIHEEVNQKLKEMLKMLGSIKDTAILIDRGLDSRLNTIENSIAELKDFKVGVQALQIKQKNWTNSRVESIRSSWYKFTGASLSLVVIPMAALLLVTWISLNEEWAKYKLLYLPCMALSVLCVIVSVFLTELVLLGQSMTDTCEMLGDLKTEAGLYTYSKFLTPKATDFFNICLAKQGDIVSILGIDQNLQFLSHLRLLREKIKLMRMDVTELTNFRSLSINREFIEEALLLYINVADTDVPREQDPATVLMELNSWSDAKMIDGYQRDEGKCRVTTSDNWVFYFSDCKHGYDEYVPPTNPSEDRGKKCCMELANWTPEQVIDRYDDYLKCSYVPVFGTVAKAIAAHHQRLLDFVKSVHSVFGKIKESFEYLDRFILDYTSRTVAQVQLTEDYLENMGQVLDLASSEAGGLRSKLNCSFVRTLVENVSANVCQNANPGLYLLTLLLCASVSSGLFLTAAILVLMRRMKKRLRRH